MNESIHSQGLASDVARDLEHPYRALALILDLLGEEMGPPIADVVRPSFLRSQVTKEKDPVLLRGARKDLFHGEFLVQAFEQVLFHVRLFLGRDRVQVRDEEDGIGGQSLGQDRGQLGLLLRLVEGLMGGEDEDEGVAHLGGVQNRVEGVRVGSREVKALLEPRERQMVSLRDSDVGRASLECLDQTAGGLLVLVLQGHDGRENRRVVGTPETALLGQYLGPLLLSGLGELVLPVRPAQLPLLITAGSDT